MSRCFLKAQKIQMVEGGEVPYDSCGRYPRLAKSDATPLMSAPRGPGPAEEGALPGSAVPMGSPGSAVASKSLAGARATRSRGVACDGLRTRSGCQTFTVSRVRCAKIRAESSTPAEPSGETGFGGNRSSRVAWADLSHVRQGGEAGCHHVPSQGKESQQSPGGRSCGVPKDLMRLAAVAAPQLLCQRPASAAAKLRAVPPLCSQRRALLPPEGPSFANSPSVGSGGARHTL